MHWSTWREGSAAVRDYVRKSGNHHNNRNNQRDWLTAGIRKHELLNTKRTMKLRWETRLCVLFSLNALRLSYALQEKLESRSSQPSTSTRTSASLQRVEFKSLADDANVFGRV